MIATSSCSNHVPFGRVVYESHPGVTVKTAQSRSLSEAVGNISICETQGESWSQRHNEGNDTIEEIYYKDKTVVLSVTSGSQIGPSKLVKTFTQRSNVHFAFWCSFLLPRSDVDPKDTECWDDVQDGICVVETNTATIFTTRGVDHHVALPFHVSGAWPMERGILFQRSLVERFYGNAPYQLPVWFTMLHPLGDLAPVIYKGASLLSYVTDISRQLIHVSNSLPYLAVMYETSSKVHSIHQIRRAAPEEEITYTDLGNMPAALADTSKRQTHIASHSLHTPGRASGFLSLSSVLSPSMSPRVSAIGSPSLRSARFTASPSVGRLTTLSMNSPSLASVNSQSMAANRTSHSPSVSVTRSPFVSSHHHSNQTQDTVIQPDVLEPIRPDVCLQHIWTDNYSSSGRASRVFLVTDLCGQSHLCMLVPANGQLRCIKIGLSNSEDGCVIFGMAINLQAKDALPCPHLNMILLLDMESSLYLYSGSIKIAQIYIPRLSLSAHAYLDGTPQRGGTLLTSSRPPSARDASSRPTSMTPTTSGIVFEADEEGTWSPVPVELNDSTHLLNQVHEYRSISSITSVVKHHVVFTLLNGDMCRTDIPEITSDAAVTMFIKALSSYLPYAAASHAIPRWYLHRHRPGQDETSNELANFFHFVADQCGILMAFSGQDQMAILDDGQPLSPQLHKKRARMVHQPCSEDWALLQSTAGYDYYSKHAHLFGMTLPDVVPSGDKGQQMPSDSGASGVPKEMCVKADPKALLAPHLYTVCLILHLCYEEMKLNTLFEPRLHQVAEFLIKMTQFLRLSKYAQVYTRDYPDLAEQESCRQKILLDPFSVVPPSWLPSEVYTTCSVAERILLDDRSSTCFFLPGVNLRRETLLKLYAIFQSGAISDDNVNFDFLKAFPVIGRKGDWMSQQDTLKKPPLICKGTAELMLLYMCKQGFTSAVLDSIPFALTLVLREAIYSCQSQPNINWPVEALRLIGREDVVALKQPAPPPHFTPSSAANMDVSTTVDGMECMDKKVINVRWSSDMRVEEVKRCLRSSQPMKITLQQKPEVSDHQFLEEKEKHLLSLCQRTMALPVGRGMLTMCCYRPLLTEMLNVPPLCLTGKSQTSQSSVELPGDMIASLSVWPQFHNGAASGLSLDVEAQVDSTWILYNKPKTSNLSNEHAGFLMALGINGHLSSLARLSLHDYLVKGHEMTAIAILLGISATMRGTMDIPTVRLLTIHVPALLPPSSTQLDIAHNAKIAAIVGLGFVYSCSAHRHIASVLLREIDRPPGQTKDECTDRESYALSAGLALGMVMQGKGSDVIGLTDMNLSNQLYLLMAGGHRTPEMMRSQHHLSGNGQVWEGELINTDVTSAGATLSLGLMFFNLKSPVVCDWLKIPESQYLLEFIRPDLLQLRVIAKSLVTWDDIIPTEAWLTSHIPAVVSQHAFQRPSTGTGQRGIDYETMSQAYCYLTSGACFSIALKFAGSHNQNTYDLLLKYTQKFLDLHQKPHLVDQCGKSVLENSLCVCLLSLAMVMSGSGHIEVMKICRFLRTRIGAPHVNYASHMAVHMAMSLLFLGSGRYSLSNKPLAVPAMLCAFFPKFPVHANDNRYHLQALRHLYPLAAEPRLLMAEDVDTRRSCYLPLEITLKPTSYYDAYTYQIFAPCILPAIDILQQIKIIDKRYWPLTFSSENNLECLRKLLSAGSHLLVKQRAGHLPYTQDPQGIIGAMSRAMVFDGTLAASKAWAMHGSIGYFPQLFVPEHKEDGKQTLLRAALKDCLSEQKPELIAVYQTLEKIQNCAIGSVSGLDLQQLSLVSTYCLTSRLCTLNKDLVESVLVDIKEALLDRLVKSGLLLSLLSCAKEESLFSPSDVWRYMAFANISCSSAQYEGYSVPGLMVAFRLPWRVAGAVCASRRP